MGYDVHIIRAADWTEAEAEAEPITREEWLSLVSSDPDIEADPENGPDDFLFVAHLEKPSLWWRGGEVYTKHPDDVTIRKMIEVAGRLGARVQGDSFHVYSLRGGDLVEQLEEPSSGESGGGWWRHLVGWIRGRRRHHD